MDVPKPQSGQRIKRASHSRLAPLSFERIAILSAVAAGPIDKARIAEEVLADTVAAIVIRKSTAYYLISELTEKGYLQEAGSFTLTNKGWHALQMELKRIEQQRLILKQHLHI